MMKNLKNTIYITFILLTLIIISSCSESKEVLQTKIDSISRKWVPDKKEGIFKVEITKLKNKEIGLKGEISIDAAKNDLLSVFKQQGYSVDDKITILPDSTMGDKKWALINVSVAQLRAKPNNSSELVSQATLGTPVKVLKRQSYWVLVQTPDNYIAWVKELSLSFLSEDDFHKWKNSERVIYTNIYGTILDNQGIITSDIVEGCILQKISESDERIMALHPKGDTILLDNKYIRDFNEWKNDTIYTISELINYSKQLKGIPYLWGGTSIKGMDCSGFIKTIYFNKGIIISRDASQQALFGDSISLADGYNHLQKGDLLFFESAKSKEITHVALYLGNKEYIQAAGRVKITSLDSTKSNYSAFRVPTLKLAKRYTGKQSQKGICYVKNHKWY